MTNKLINKITKFAMIPILAVGLNGCRDASNGFCKEGKYNSYRIRIGFDESKRSIDIYSNKSNSFNHRAVIGNEFISDLKDKKIFSTIGISDQLLEGDSILNYANSDSLEKIYNYVYKNGIDCDEVKN